MTNDKSAPENPKVVPTPSRCLFGSLLSAGLGFALYNLTKAIGYSFYTKPFTSHNPIVLKIGSAVRTLVFGLASLGTFIFAFVSVGLILLAIQLLIAKNKPESP